MAPLPAELAVSLVLFAPKQLLPLEFPIPHHLAHTFLAQAQELPSLVAKLRSLYELHCCVQVNYIHYPTT